MNTASDSSATLHVEVERCRIAFVPTGHIQPHEIAAVGHQEDLTSCVLADQQIRNPIIVTFVDGLWILCDGTHRLAVARRLGLTYVPAQVLDLHDADLVRMGAWGHAVSMDSTPLITTLRTAGFSVERRRLSEAEAAVTTDNDLAWIAARPANGHAFLVRRRDRWQSDLRSIVDAYSQVAMQRVPVDEASIDLEQLFTAYPDAGLFVRFPGIPANAVGTLIRDPIPSGITRFQIVGGRAVGVNVPLDLLRTSTPDWRRHQWLDHLLSRPRTCHPGPVIVQESTGPRHYSEAVVSFDPSLVISNPLTQH